MPPNNHKKQFLCCIFPINYFTNIVSSNGKQSDYNYLNSGVINIPGVNEQVIISRILVLSK